MATFSKVLLSGSVNGRQVKILTTTTPGTAIHQAVSGTTSLDELWLWASNSDTVERLLTLQWGGTTSPDDIIQIPIPPQSGPVLIAPGWLLNNSLVARGFAAAANVIDIIGYVNRITV
jgi:hypothetical protein